MRLHGHVSFSSSMVTVKCVGRIIFGDEVDQIVRRVQDGKPNARVVVVDLSGVIGLSSGDIGGLWLRYMKARALGWRLAFINLPPELLTLLESLSIEHAFEIFPDEISAARAFSNRSRGAAA